MRWLRGVFWGAVTGVDCLALALFITLYFGSNSVLYMLWDATYSVWYFAAGGAILGISFAYSTRNKRYSIKKESPRVSWGRLLTTRVANALHPVKGLRIREGKKWKTS